MADITSGYTRKCKDNTGGLNKVYLFSYESYSRSQIVTNGNVLTSFPETTIYSYEYVSEPSFNNKVQEDAGGKFYNEELSIQLSKIGVDEELKKLLEKDLRAIIQDRNGKYRILGLYKGIECISIKATLGTAKNTFNGYTIQLEGKEERESFYINDLQSAGFILDGQTLVSYPNSVARFSLSDISGGSNPVVARVQSGSQTEQDFTASEWIDGTLLSYCGSNDGVLKGIYNQENGDYYAANNNNIIVVSGGVLKVLDGRPSWDMANLCWLSGATINGSKSIFIKAKNDLISNINYIVFESESISSKGGVFFGGFNAAVTGIGAFINPSVVQSTVEDLLPHYATYINDGSNSNIYVDGSLQASGVARDYDISVIGRAFSGLSHNGLITEIVIYDTSQISDRVSIETKINR
jgi:hypothetical protein